MSIEEIKAVRRQAERAIEQILVDLANETNHGVKCADVIMVENTTMCAGRKSYTPKVSIELDSGIND